MMDIDKSENAGVSASEHLAITRYYEFAAPIMLELFEGIPLLWATADDGFTAGPVYHRRLEDTLWPLASVTFTEPSGNVYQAARFDAANCERLVSVNGAVALCSWTPTVADPQLAAYGRIHLAAHGCAGFEALFAAAIQTRGELQTFGLDAIPVYDGWASLTLWIPLAGAPAFPNVYQWLKHFCAEFAARYPQTLTVAHLRADRGDRIYLGTHSNGVGELSILPYSLLCMPHLPVQWPLVWNDVFAGAARDDGAAAANLAGVTAANFSERFAATPNVFRNAVHAIGEQMLPADKFPTMQVESFTLATLPEFEPTLMGAAASPHGYLTAAAITILEDGRTRTVDEILADGIAAKLLPADLPRKYLYVALHEYITRTVGGGAVPAFVQPDTQHFRINRPADDWPAVALAKLPDWIGDTARAALVERLRTSAVGDDPAAFEITVCDAFAALGFAAQHIGGTGQPDGILDAPLGADGYRVAIECKTAHAGAAVANPRPEEPAAFRDRANGQYAILVGPQFSDERTFNDELQTHGTALWTVDDVVTALTLCIGPDEIRAAFAAGHAVTVLVSIAWEREHGRRKRVAVIAEYIARCGWQAQVRCGAAIAPAERPRLTRDSLMLLVDQALFDAGVATGATSAEFDAALVMAETQTTIRRAGGSDGSVSWIVSYPAGSATLA